MSLRKVAGLLAAFGLTVGLIGGGVGAVFQDQVTATENINVGTFSCGITTATTGATLGAVDALGYAHTVSYTAPTIMSSAAGSAPFSFTVKNTGSIPDVLTVSTSPASSPFSIIGAPFAAVPLAAGASHPYNTGVSWAELSNANLGASGSVTWTVNCGEAAAAGNVIFDNTAASLPSNLPSYGPEAYSYTEWGGGATFAGTARKLSTATVTMSSWACQSGSWDAGCVTTPGATYDVPITFSVYAVGTGNVVGTLITSKTQTFAIPYRPSADTTNCSATPTKWFDSTTCFNGKAVNITFTFPAGTTLPGAAIFGVTFSTRDSGYSPLGGTGGPTDSLNIATYPGTGTATQAVVGTWLPNATSSYLSPRGASTLVGLAAVTQMPTGPSDNFVGYEPAVQITATN
jgi:hypothetical protein